jgi:NitT/TauT family transport system substrate-binding protein
MHNECAGSAEGTAMTISRRKALLGTLAVSLLPAAQARAQTPTRITFSLDFRALGRHAAWYVAFDKGYYRQEGLDVFIVPSQGTAQAIQNLEANAAQFAFSDVAGLVAARANSGSTAKMIAVIYQKAPYAVFTLKSGADVTEPKQLEGLDIGSGAGSFTQKVIEAFMIEKGLNPSTVKYTNIDPAARVGMLVSKKIPAIETFVMSKPGIDKAAPGDAQTFLFADHGFKLYSNGILARADYLTEHPDIAKGFVKASLQGWRDTIADPKAAADIVGKYIKGLDPDVALAEIKIVDGLVDTAQTRADGLGTIDPQIMAASVGLIAKSVAGGGKIKPTDVYETAFLPQPPIKP